jgi:hypothetical protein
MEVEYIPPGQEPKQVNRYWMFIRAWIRANQEIETPLTKADEDDQVET